MNTKLQSFFEGAPSAREIDYHIGDDPVFWDDATPGEAIEEIKYIRDTYYEDGHNNYIMLHPDLDLPSNAPRSQLTYMKKVQKEVRQEVKEIKALIKYLENKLNKEGK